MADLLDRLQSELGDRYTVVRTLGSGGMATVYLAEDLKHHRQVALKVMHPDHAELIGRNRFLREIRIAASLLHPNIVPLFDSGEAGGLVFYVMPFVDGETLKDRLEREGPLPVDEALQIAEDVAGGLEYAHALGVIHRDIKPGNILLSGGRALLADFGIAQALGTAGAGPLTETGHVVGTPAYMSPEQASGAEVDGRADLYALGCVLYEMLSGEPPFAGSSRQVVLARHLQERPPSLRVARPSVSHTVQTAVEKALEKTPADRFRTAAGFAAALKLPDTSAGARLGRRVPARLLAALIAATALAVWRFWPPAGPPLDPNRVMVFPLVTLGGQDDGSAGWDVALTIEAALEHTQPLKWIDGWTWLPDSIRNAPGLLTPQLAAATSRDRLAAFYVSGVIRRTGSALSVLLRLNDVAGDSVIAQQTATGPATRGLASLGLEAVKQLLPGLLDPDRQVDLSPLTDRDPGAVALSIQGDREYRRSQFGTALDFYQRAVDEDPLLAFAAVKGAQAASWIPRWDDAEELITLAVESVSLLPSKYQHFAIGLKAYLTGEADSASVHLRLALREDPEWSEALMALGETYFHLFPDEAPLDSLAEAAFEQAAARDASFMPPLLHLTEIKLQKGQVSRAEELIGRLRYWGADTTWIRRLDWLLECVRVGSNEVDWGSRVRVDAEGVLYNAKTLSGGGAQRSCAKAAFRTLLAELGDDAVERNLKWGALLGLQGLLLAEGREGEALALLDSALASGARGAYSLYIFDTMAGAPFEPGASEAERVARAGAGEYYERADPRNRWLLGVWQAWRGDLERAGRILDGFRSEVDPPDSRLNGLLGASLAAHIALARGDVDDALTRLRRLRPTGRLSTQSWEFGEPLPLERFLLAKLLSERGRWTEAYRVATTFDHPAPIMNLPFLRPSLVLRLEAAEAMGDTRLARRYRQRLASLGWQPGAADEPAAASRLERDSLPQDSRTGGVP